MTEWTDVTVFVATTLGACYMGWLKLQNIQNELRQGIEASRDSASDAKLTAVEAKAVRSSQSDILHGVAVNVDGNVAVLTAEIRRLTDLLSMERVHSASIERDTHHSSALPDPVRIQLMAEEKK